MDLGQTIMEALVRIIPLVLSLTVHEFAHAWSAWKLGDDTARMQGRLTLDPMAHIDPIGTLLLPALGVPFGWAKPVPVNPARFRRGVNMDTGMMLTAIAGPLSNMLLAIGSAVTYGLLLRYSPETIGNNPGVLKFITWMIIGNVSLAVFNMLPIPPLDGSRVVEKFMPYSMRGSWEKVVQFGPFLLLGVLFFGRELISGPAGYILGMISSFVTGIAYG
jgi:Zn-dependent protease